MIETVRIVISILEVLLYCYHHSITIIKIKNNIIYYHRYTIAHDSDTSIKIVVVAISILLSTITITITYYYYYYYVVCGSGTINSSYY